MGVVERVAGVGLAYAFTDGAGPVVVFCSGYGSDMGGTKAMRLWERSVAQGRAMLRFDYAGHGQSGGKFIDGCVGEWAEDAAFVVGRVIPGREVVIVGSSMGGWIGVMLALRLGELVKGMVLIAPALDFTEGLVRERLSDAQREVLARDGVIYPPSAYGEPMPLTTKLIEDGARHLLLGGGIGVKCPVRVLHGMRDEDVPWEWGLRVVGCVESEDVRVVLVKDGDHRLSREGDLVLLEGLVGELLGLEGWRERVRRGS